MTADTWPDGTPKRRAGFDPAVWSGTKPAVAPLPTTIDIGAVAWTKADDDPDSKAERIGGMVVARHVDHATGEIEKVTVVRGDASTGTFTIRRHDLDAATIDRSNLEPRSPHRLHRVARELCRFLGQRKAGYITGFDRWLLEVAVGLVVLDEEDRAALTEARDEHRREAS